MKIETNNFTRNYKIVNNNNEIVFSSKSALELPDIKEYYEYVNNIDSLSTVYYNLTKRCNFNCTYCYSVHEDSVVTLEDNERIIQKLNQLNTKTVTLIGGEPFCHPHFHEILKLCIDNPYFEEVCVVTNGSLIDETKMDLYCNSKVIMQISLDGTSEQTNSKTRGKNHFDVVYANIIKLKRRGANIVVMKVITKTNIAESMEFYSFYKRNNIDVGFFMVKQVDSESKPTIEQLKELLNFIYINESYDIIRTFEIVNFADNMMFNSLGFPIMHCGAGISAISVMPNGDVYPCVKMEKIGVPIVNILEDNSLNRIKNNRKKIIAEEFVTKKEECMNCDILYFCGGGCRAEEIKGRVCEHNCQYFHFAKKFFLEKQMEKYKNNI